MAIHLTGFPVFFVILTGCFLLPLLLFTVSQVVQSRNPTPYKHTTYESGMLPIGDARLRFDVKFYLYALLFILFDIETMFLFPWAVSFNNLGLMGLVEMVLFIGILTLGLVYAWRKGYLKWQ
ncbi:MAG: NADH-quinone oxidoreductase subunit A [Vampirovibrionales bacterium]